MVRTVRDLPLAPGSISLRMYPQELPPDAALEELCSQAQLAERVGFDGLMTSEHHGGFRAYLPNPLLVAGFLLGETRSLWASPCPLLLPLRPWSQTAEDLAWLAARHPGRVGAGFAAGGLALDFELVGLRFEDRLALFKTALPEIVKALRGEVTGPLADDPAVARCAEHPLPCVAAAMSPAAAHRAGKLGIGMLCDSLQSPERLRELVAAHRASLPEAAAPPAVILIRRVWLGAPPQADVDAQMDFYRSYASGGAQKRWGSDELVAGETGEELAEQLAAVLDASGCDALNLRVHTHGVPAERIREQIERVGREVLPALRSRLGAPTPGAASRAHA